MAKKVTPLVAPLSFRVVLADGAEYDYTSTPVDVWRAEKLCGQPVHEALQTFGGMAALAFSCALRAGHAFRQKGQTEADAFQSWLELIEDLQGVNDDEEPDAGPLDGPQSGESPP